MSQSGQTVEGHGANGSSNGANGNRRNGVHAATIEDQHGIFDEELYLKSHIDVAAAVRSGAMSNGYEHWIRFGLRECVEGRREDCFNPEPSAHFRIGLAAEGELFVAPVDGAHLACQTLILHLEDGSRVNVDAARSACSRKIEFRDSSGRWLESALAIVCVPPEFVTQNAPGPRAVGFTIVSTEGEVHTASFAGVRAREGAPAFRAIDDAREFVLTAKRVSTSQQDGAALMRRVAEVVNAPLRQPVSHEQWTSRMYVEQLVTIEGIGMFVGGWVVPASALLERCRAFCPETGECVEFHASMTRTRRPDVREAFKEKLGAGSTELLGCFALVHLPEASRLARSHVVFGVTAKGAPEELLPPVQCSPSTSFLDAAKLVFSYLNPMAPEFEQAMSNNLAPAMAGLWARERDGKSRQVTVRSFGERIEKPRASVIVPIYGRSDFIKYQLALFANDEDFTSRRIELIYFVDDPRLIEAALELCLSLEPLYGVSTVVAYTGDNHGYSGANNLGASVARGELLVLLNSDVMPKKSGWVSELIRAHASAPGCGVLGTKLLYHDESLQHAGMAFERFPFWNGLHGNNHPGKGLPNRSEPDAPPREVQAVTGACLAISASLYRDLGGLCEDFAFGDFEDSELCLRARSAGTRVYYAPAIELYHLERQSQSLLPDGSSWRWQLTVYNAWLQNRRWKDHIDRLTHSFVGRKGARNGAGRKG